MSWLRVCRELSLEWFDLPEVRGLRLRLVQEQEAARPLSPGVTRALMDHPPFWCLVWPSGRLLARMLASGAIDCRGKSVLDFGCGGGAVGLAAALSGAERVVCCDLDPEALEMTRLNAAASGVEVETLERAPSDTFDLTLLADVLYDHDNLPLLEHLREGCRELWVADSKMHDPLPGLKKVRVFEEVAALPDLDPHGEFSSVSLYKSSS